MEKIRKLLKFFNGLNRRGKFVVLALIGLVVVLVLELVR